MKLRFLLSVCCLFPRHGSHTIFLIVFRLPPAGLPSIKCVCGTGSALHLLIPLLFVTITHGAAPPNMRTLAPKAKARSYIGGAPTVLGGGGGIYCILSFLDFPDFPK